MSEFNSEIVLRAQTCMDTGEDESAQGKSRESAGNLFSRILMDVALGICSIRTLLS